MSTVTIYHYPRCSKSRAALALLEDRGMTPEVILYHDTPLSTDTLKVLLNQLGFHSATQLIRSGEDLYKRLKLNHPDITEEQLIAAMAQHPCLIERPIVVYDGEARVGRPLENIEELLSQG